MEDVDYILELPLSILKYFGLYTTSRTKRVTIVSSLYCVLFTFSEVMILLQLLFLSADVDEFVYNAEGFAIFAQLFVKFATAGYNQEKLIKMLHDCKHFWYLDVCTDEALKIKLHMHAVNVARFQKLFSYSSAFAISVVVIISFIEGTLPFGNWNINSPENLHTPTFFCQVLGVPAGALVVTGVDGIFLALTVGVSIQFQILCNCLSQLSVAKHSRHEYSAKIRTYIQQHTFLIKFAHSIQDYFSAALLNEFLTICPLICGEMCLLSESTSVRRITKHGLSLLCLVLQWVFYCVTADILSSTAEAVSDAMYDSDWYSEYLPTERGPVIRIIQNAHRKVGFTAGGLTEINLTSLETVLRVSLSFCTLFRTLNSK